MVIDRGLVLDPPGMEKLSFGVAVSVISNESSHKNLPS